MQINEWTTIDKSEWGSGPWDDEPDKIHWIDDETDLDCLMVRGPGGHWCGYVGVPPEHPWHGHDYSNGEVDIDVHGGLTFASDCSETKDPSKGVCHVPAGNRPANVWWFGFDCAHLGDRSPAYRSMFNDGGDMYWTRSMVERETENLARQIKDAARKDA